MLESPGVTKLYSLSLQLIDHQREARSRVEPLYEFLSDANHKFTHELGLPTFDVEGDTFNKRLKLVIEDDRVEHVFYPVFPLGNHTEEVIH